MSAGQVRGGREMSAGRQVRGGREMSVAATSARRLSDDVCRRMRQPKLIGAHLLCCRLSPVVLSQCRALLWSVTKSSLLVQWEHGSPEQRLSDECCEDCLSAWIPLLTVMTTHG